MNSSVIEFFLKIRFDLIKIRQESSFEEYVSVQL